MSLRLFTGIMIRRAIISLIVPNSVRKKTSYNLDNLYVETASLEALQQVPYIYYLIQL